MQETGRAFNLTLEILQGCKYKCAGCMVDKEYDPGPFDRDHEDLVSLVKDMKYSGYRLREFTIGPVDVIASRAGIGVLDEPLIHDLADLFDSMVLPLAMLSDDGLPELCEKINTVMKGKSFTLATPFPMKSVDNIKHQEAIRKRVEFIIEHIPDVKFELLYLTVNMADESARMFTPELNERIHDLDFGVRKLVEYSFPHVRKGFDNLMNRQSFINDFRKFTDTIKHATDTKYNRIVIKPNDDSLEVTYRDGKVYYTPTLIEKFPIFDSRFELPTPWSGYGLEDLEDSIYLDELVKWSTTDLCVNCIHSSRCSKGDVHAIMSHLNYDECLVDMRNRWDLKS